METTPTKALLATLALAAAGLASAVAVGAGAPPPPREVVVEPTTVAPGTVVSYSGTGCVDPDTGDGTGMNVVVLAPGLAPASGSDPAGERIGFLTVEADGTWAGSYRVPATGDEFLLTDGAVLELVAECYRNVPGPDRVFAYDPVTLTVDLPGPSTTSVPTTVPAAPSPEPAAAVAATPGYTG